jgi:hypothetical protein
MSENHAVRQSTQKTVAGSGRVFKFPYKNVPIVDAEMWEQMEAAARIPRKGRHYPEIVEAPDVKSAET